MTRPIYKSFAEYLAAFPGAEVYKDWLTNYGRGDMVLVLPAEEEAWGSLPGQYYWARVGRYPPKPPPVKRRSQQKREYPFEDTPWFVVVGDADDGAYKRHFETEDEAKAELLRLCDLVPFYLYQLEDFGYAPD